MRFHALIIFALTVSATFAKTTFGGDSTSMDGNWTVHTVPRLSDGEAMPSS